jgi:hypothetical protein
VSSRFHDKRISFFILIGKNLRAFEGECRKRPVLRAFPNENKKLVHSQGLPQRYFHRAVNASLVSDFTKKPAVTGFSALPLDGGKDRPEKKQKNFTKALAVFFRSEYITATDAADMIRDTRRAISSVGRAPRLHRGCREFESLIAHHFPIPSDHMSPAKCFFGPAQCFVRNFPHMESGCPAFRYYVTESEPMTVGIAFPAFLYSKSIRLFRIPTASPNSCFTA